MNAGRMTYNYGKVNECIQVVSNLPLDAENKKAHREAFKQVTDAYDFCYEMTMCLLFEKEYTPWKDYEREMCIGTKKGRDSGLRQCVFDLRRTIRGIYAHIENGEVDIEY